MTTGRINQVTDMHAPSRGVLRSGRMNWTCVVFLRLCTQIPERDLCRPAHTPGPCSGPRAHAQPLLLPFVHLSGTPVTNRARPFNRGTTRFATHAFLAVSNRARRRTTRRRSWQHQQYPHKLCCDYKCYTSCTTTIFLQPPECRRPQKAAHPGLAPDPQGPGPLISTPASPVSRVHRPAAPTQECAYCRFCPKGSMLILDRAEARPSEHRVTAQSLQDRKSVV